MYGPKPPSCKLGESLNTPLQFVPCKCGFNPEQCILHPHVSGLLLIIDCSLPHTHAGNRVCHISECFIMMQFACQASVPAAAAADYGSAPGCVLFMIHLLPFKIHQYTLMEVKLETPGKAGAWEMNFPLLLFRTAVFRKAMQRGQCAVRRLQRPPCVCFCL